MVPVKRYDFMRVGSLVGSKVGEVVDYCTAVASVVFIPMHNAVHNDPHDDDCTNCHNHYGGRGLWGGLGITTTLASIASNPVAEAHDRAGRGDVDGPKPHHGAAIFFGHVRGAFRCVNKSSAPFFEKEYIYMEGRRSKDMVSVCLVFGALMLCTCEYMNNWE